ncbi:MAG: hypothetical protein GQF41_3488 [Candidatus Rifleibacterium amylolyticum]|nr:MAG: hypothetical protein GQF41_3488 [Candidatus Rifleibacterium amylolyticum]
MDSATSPDGSRRMTLILFESADGFHRIVSQAGAIELYCLNAAET